jgi:biopolymer transport protein ExbD
MRFHTTVKRPVMDMTPMIDVVFLLLTFFVMTFKILTPEGDFNVKMPKPGRANAADVPAESLRIQLRATPNGELATILLGEQPINSFAELRKQVIAASLTNPKLEVELIPDEHLCYENVVAVITAVNGELRNGQVHKICDKIKFVKRSH